LLAVDPIAELTSRATRYYTWYSFEVSPTPIPSSPSIPIPTPPSTTSSAGGRPGQYRWEIFPAKARAFVDEILFLIFQQTTNYEIPSFTVDNKERLLTSEKMKKLQYQRAP